MISLSRRKSRVVYIRDIPIGGFNPITVQSMTKTPTSNYPKVIEEIKEYEKAGCDMVRMTVNHEDAVSVIDKIKKEISIPLIADIHFDYRLALAAIEKGIDKIRINPGNIGKEEKIRDVLKKADDYGVPIRIGINAGSLEKDILRKYEYPTSDGMVESALRQIEICDKYNFKNVIMALKSSDVMMMIEANRKFVELSDIPLHLGVTEAGPLSTGIIKSSIGIGTLLSEGVGDTIRVSLTDSGVEEIHTGFKILKSLNLGGYGPNIVSCPTCGRLEVDLIPIVKKIEKAVEGSKKPLKIALMGCLVNGPGESKDADIGISCGKEYAVLYIKGESQGKIKENEIIKRLMEEIEKF